MKRYREWNPRQLLLMPPSMQDWLEPGHLAYFLLDVLADFDLSAIEAAIQGKDRRGTRPYSPRMMVGLLLYGYCTGVRSSRKLEQATHEIVPFRILAGDHHPDHSVISAFRKTHGEALGKLFLEVLRLCQQAGLVTLGHVSLDGTKLHANASKHKAMSYERMLKSEHELQEEVERLLREAAETDQAEDERYGKDRRGDELPEELRTREGRLEKIREAKEALRAEAARTKALDKREQAERNREKVEHAPAADPTEKARQERRAEKSEEEATRASETALQRAEERAREARAKAAEKREKARTPQARRKATMAENQAVQAEQDRDHALATLAGNEQGDEVLPEHHVQADREGAPHAKAQRNFTDPDSRIMKSGGAYLQAYNCQAVVDAEHQIIVAQALTNQAPDQEHLRPLLDQAIENCGQTPEILSADAGYWSESNAEYCADRGLDAYIATGRKEPASTTTPEPEASAGPKGPREAMREKLRTPQGAAIYAKRKAIVEPPFGQIKSGQGIAGLLLRGLHAARAEWAFICASHNLLKLWRAKTALAARG